MASAAFRKVQTELNRQVESKKVTISGLAKTLKTSRVQVRRIKDGTTDDPGIDTVDRLARLLGLTLEVRRAKTTSSK